MEPAQAWTDGKDRDHEERDTEGCGQGRGVSYATVSRALSGSNQIGKSTRERIVRLCDEMGYTGNYVARSMVMKKTYLLGLVVPAIGK